MRECQTEKIKKEGYKMSIKRVVVTEDFTRQSLQSTLNTFCAKYPVEDIDVLMHETKVGHDIKPCFVSIIKIGESNEVQKVSE